MAEETPTSHGFLSETIEELPVSKRTASVANEVPDIVVGRLPVYLCVLANMAEEGKRNTSSQELGERLGVSPAQIRKDLSHFGEFGKQGAGYDIIHLQDQLKRILHIEHIWPVALVGCGDLGHALANYGGFVADGFEIVAVFDNDPKKIGQEVAGKIVMDITELARVIREKKIKVAIIAVPKSTAQRVADLLTEAKVQAILNYAPIRLTVPSDVRVQYIDPGARLQHMAFYLNKEPASGDESTSKSLLQLQSQDAEIADEYPARDQTFVVADSPPEEMDGSFVSDASPIEEIDESSTQEQPALAISETRSWYQPVTEEELVDGRQYVEAIEETPLPEKALITLTDWEKYLVPQVRQVEILGELPLTCENAQQLGRLFGQLFHKRGPAGSERIIQKAYRATFATFLVIQGVCGYEEGDYWSGVGQATDQDLDANWKLRLGQLFETTIRTFGLTTFPDYPPRAHRYLSRILGHGGIPNYCLDDYFENLLRPAVTRDVYADMSVEELIDEWLLRSGGRYLVDKPVLRFLEFGGRVAEDFVERSRELAREFLDTGLVPAAEEIGLPRHVVENFHAWAVERDGLALSKTDARERTGLRLRRPDILLDPRGEGLILDLPPQGIPATISQADVVWHVCAGEQEYDVSVRVRRSGYDLRTTGETLLLNAPAESYEVSLSIDGQVQRTWRYPGPDPEHPLLVFDAARGTLLRRAPSLPARPLWLLYPRGADLEVAGDGRPVEEFPPLPWGWSRFRGQAWDLGQATQLRLRYKETLFTIPIRQDESARRPRLAGGHAFAGGDLASAQVPLYVGRPPAVRVPLAGRTPPVEELGRWRLTLRSKWAASPERDLSLPLLELRPYLREADGVVELPLSAPPLLGETPYGNYVVRLRGPLGRDAELALRLVPHLAVTGHETLYIPDPQAGPQPVSLLVETEPDTRLELQGEGSDDRLGEVDREETRWLHEIQADPETTLIETNLVWAVAGDSRTIRVPLRLPVYRLRWVLQDEGSTTPLSERLNGQVIAYPVEALLQAQSPMLILELPGIDARAVRLTLRLLDIDGGECQAHSQTAVRAEQARWRFELDRFTDTIRGSDSPLLRFVLRLEGLPHAPEATEIPLVRLTQSLMVEDIEVKPLLQAGEVLLQVHWQSAHRLRNRFIRFWPLWQPWEEPIYQRIPDEAAGEFLVRIDPAKPQLQPSKYRLELGIDDPWSPPTRIERPASSAQNTLDVALVPPERRLQLIDEKGKNQGGTFGLALEYAIIRHELGHYAAADQTLGWCYHQLDTATVPQTMALIEYLKETGDEQTLKATQLKLFSARRIKALLDAHQQGDVTRDQFRSYLANMPRSGLLPVETAKLLLDVQEAQVGLPATQRLIEKEEPAVIDHILARCKRGTLSDADALAMLSLGEDWAGGELEKRLDDPVALRLLGRLSGVHLIKVGTWVQCMAGWGQVQHIIRLSDEGAVEYFLRKETGYRLGVILRPQHDAEPVTVEVLEDRCKLRFERAQKLYHCTKVKGCSFITQDQSLLTHDHNRAAHGGMGPQFIVEDKSVFLSDQPPKYSTRAPRNMLI
jgi:redox-sensing transcriptional repressor